MDRIVPAEILSLRQDRLAERRERQPAFLVSLVATPQVVHFDRKWPLCETKYSGDGSKREFFQQSAGLPIPEHASLEALFVMGKHVERMHVACRDQLQNP